MKAKYIDADLLRAVIKEHILFYAGQANLLDGTNTLDGFDETLSIIDSLQQQEQPSLPSNLDEAAEEYDEAESWCYEALPYPRRDAFKAGAKWMEGQMKQEQMEVDLEREAVMFCFDKGINITPRQAKQIAHHFYELGLNARKEE